MIKSLCVSYPSQSPAEQDLDFASRDAVEGQNWCCVVQGPPTVEDTGPDACRPASA